MSFEKPVSLLPDFDPGRKYRQSELNQLADEILREDSRSELCRDCGERGEKTGEVREGEQEAIDAEGTPLVVQFPEFVCSNGHHWYQGEGAVRTIGGENPILFEEHLHSRRRREIYAAAGQVDPSIVSGLYYRAHPQGRKINSLKARTEQGASYYA